MEGYQIQEITYLDNLLLLNLEVKRSTKTISNLAKEFLAKAELLKFSNLSDTSSQFLIIISREFFKKEANFKKYRKNTTNLFAVCIKGFGLQIYPEFFLEILESLAKQNLSFYASDGNDQELKLYFDTGLRSKVQKFFDQLLAEHHS